MFANLLLKLDAGMRLGFPNVLAVAKYRWQARKGLIAAKPIAADGAMTAPVFQAIETYPPEDLSPEMASLVVAEADQQLAGLVKGLGGQPFQTGAPPDWQLNILTGERSRASGPWYLHSDADPTLGDIKGVWEMSRFDWALVFARAYRVSGNENYLRALNEWTESWVDDNPPYKGCNWMCGQEASIRLLQMLRSAEILGQSHSASLTSFVENHINRIVPTISYAIAQDNNHATSEAAALLVGGLWMTRYGPAAKRDKMHQIADKGRRYLEQLARRLILEDGGFAQYSVNYHRVMLMTMCQVEVWRRDWGATAFSDQFYDRVAKASGWLGLMVNENSGASPNLGSNDGANVFRLNGSPYRDYRAACQLAFRLFRGHSFCGPGLWDEDCYWLNVADDTEIEREYNKESIILLEYSGICRIQSPGKATGYLRIPVDRFRPHQCDALHFDLFDREGRNWLRDAGTYSYADPDILNMFAGTFGHNSLTFDDHQPMPRLSRFLFAKWLRGKVLDISRRGSSGVSITVEYKTAQGCVHRRTISVQESGWTVEDHVSGHHKKVVLQWRLPNDDWELATELRSCIAHSGDFRIEIQSNAAAESRIDSGWESPTYGIKKPMKILQVTGNHRNSEFVSRFSLGTHI